MPKICRVSATLTRKNKHFTELCVIRVTGRVETGPYGKGVALILYTCMSIVRDEWNRTFDFTRGKGGCAEC